MNHRLLQSVRSTQVVWVCMAIVLVAHTSLIVGSPTQNFKSQLTHHLTKRSFQQLECKGVYDKSIFAKLDRICEDCYNLFREPEVHSLCRRNCFNTQYFKGCVETLQLTDEMEQLQIFVKQLHGVAPRV